MGFFSSSGRSGKRARRKASSVLWGNERGPLTAGYGSAYDLAQFWNDLEFSRINEGYDKARAEMVRVGDAELSRITDAAQFARGQAGRELTSRGLTGTRAAQASRRSIAYDQSRARTNLTGALAPMFSGLEERRGAARGQAAANAFNRLSPLWAREADMQYNSAGEGAQAGWGQPVIGSIAEIAGMF